MAVATLLSFTLLAMLILQSQGETSLSVRTLVKATSTMLLVVGLIVLTLGAIAITVTSVLNRKIIMKWMQDKINADDHDDDDDTRAGEPELTNYDEVHEAPPPPPPPLVDQHEYPLFRQSELGSYANIPEEMGFHVSVNNNEQNFEGSTTGNYEDTENSRLTDEATGYLSGETYRPNYTEMNDMDYHQEKVDLLQSSGQNTTEFYDGPLYGNAPMLETAIQYDKMEGIERDIIDQTDYQNVTIVRTNAAAGNISEAEVIHTGVIHSHSPGGSNDDIDYVSVESFDLESDMVFGNQPDFSQGAVNNQSVYDADGLPVHPDAVSLNSGTLSYENFDPHRRLPGTDEHAAKFEPNRYMSGVDEYVYQHDGFQPKYQDTLNLAAPEEEDLYMNVEASRLQAQILADKDACLNPTISRRTEL